MRGIGWLIAAALVATPLAARRNVNAAVVGVATGCQLLRQLSPGEAYQLQDGVWRRWVPGQPAPVQPGCG